MFIWSGAGWLGYFIIGGVLIGALYLADAVGGVNTVERHPGLLGVSWIVSSVLCWLVGHHFNGHLPRQVFDFAGRGHTMAGIQLEFAGLLAGGLLHTLIELM